MEIKQILEARAKYVGRKGLRRRARPALFPRSAEREYKRRLLEYADEIQNVIKKEFLPLFEDIYNEAFRLRPDGVRADSWASRLQELVSRVTLRIGERAPSDYEVSELAERISTFNMSEQRRITQALGVDVLIREPYLEGMLESFSIDNVKLIKSMASNQLDQISGIAQRGIRNGASYADIAKEITEKTGAVESKANLIARDQVGKLNGQLTAVRMKEIGIDKYIWVSANDERTRESHSVMDGKVCRWDDATVYQEEGETEWRSRSSIGGVEAHPAEEINCRCSAAAYIEDVLKDLGL